MGLTKGQVKVFQTEGVLIAENVLSEEDLQPIIMEINAVIDAKAKELQAKGKLKQLYDNEPFERRLMLLAQECPDIHLNLDIQDILGRAMFEFFYNDRLLAVVEDLLGTELSCNPIQHIRAKMPWKGEGEQPISESVPWHQDAAVTSKSSETSEIITFWIPLIDAVAETGCMEVMPEVFKQGYLEHVGGNGTMIVPDLLPDLEPITAECRKGGIVIMNKYTPHRGTTNSSDKIRWSIDLRFHKTGSNSGREFHPSFVVRSCKRPDTVIRDYDLWRASWEAVLGKSAPALHRV